MKGPIDNPVNVNISIINNNNFMDLAKSNKIKITSDQSVPQIEINPQNSAKKISVFDSLFSTPINRPRGLRHKKENTDSNDPNTINATGTYHSVLYQSKKPKKRKYSGENETLNVKSKKTIETKKINCLSTIQENQDPEFKKEQSSKIVRSESENSVVIQDMAISHNINAQSTIQENQDPEFKKEQSSKIVRSESENSVVIQDMAISHNINAQEPMPNVDLKSDYTPTPKLQQSKFQENPKIKINQNENIDELCQQSPTIVGKIKPLFLSHSKSNNIDEKKGDLQDKIYLHPHFCMKSHESDSNKMISSSNLDHSPLGGSPDIQNFTNLARIATRKLNQMSDPEDIMMNVNYESNNRLSIDSQHHMIGSNTHLQHDDIGRRE